MTGAGTPYISSVRLSGAWLILTVRREGAFHPQTVHVVADIQVADDGTSDRATHPHVLLESGVKSKTVRFELSTTPEFGIESIAPVPETNSGPSHDYERFPDTVTTELTVVNPNTEGEYDHVTTVIEAIDDTHNVTDIHE
jgi:hypothetical protein